MKALRKRSIRALVVTAVVAASVCIGGPARAETICIPETIRPPDGVNLLICIDVDPTQPRIVGYDVLLNDGWVASGTIILNSLEDFRTDHHVLEGNVYVAVLRYPHPDTGDDTLEICVEAAPLIERVCRVRALP